MPPLPDASNVFLALDTALTPAVVGALFAAHGWTVRAAGQGEVELRTDGAEFLVEGTAPLLVHGLVAAPIDRLDGLLAPLRGAGITVTGEVYAPDNALLATVDGVIEEPGDEGDATGSVST